MRNGVKGDAMGERLDSQLFLGLAVQELARLIIQLGHGRSAGARSGLVGRHHHASDGRQIVQRLQSHHHLNGGAVRVRDNAVVPGHILRIHLGHYQRHVLVHAEGAGVVDHHGAGGGNRLAHGLGHAGTRREQGNVYALEGLGGHLLHGQLAGGHQAAALEGHLLARRTGTGQRTHLSRREINVVQHTQKLLPHRTRGTSHRHNGIRGNFFRPSHCKFLSFATPQRRGGREGYAEFSEHQLLCA